MDNFNLHMNISNNITNSSSSNFKFNYFNNCRNHLFKIVLLFMISQLVNFTY